jgi:hypothetical protein
MDLGRFPWWTGTLAWRAALGLVVLASALACGTGRGAVRAGSTDPAVAVARAWLDVLAAKDAERLVQMTQLPFTFASTDIEFANAPKRCDAEIGDTTRMERLIGCLEARAPDLFNELRRGSEVKLEPTDRTQLKPSLLQLLGPARPGERIVRAVIGDREGKSYELVFLIPDGSGPRTLTLVSLLAADEETTLR